MFQVDILNPDGSGRQVSVADDCMVGNKTSNDIWLDSWRVGKEHARLLRTPSGVLLEDMGSYTGTSVNGVRIATQHGPLAPTDIIAIGPYKLQVLDLHSAVQAVQAAAPHSRSSSAAARNQHATAEIHASRLAAERIQHKIQHGGEPGPAEANSATPADAYSLVLAPRALQQLEFEWRQRLHAILLETMDLRRHDVSKMSDDQLRIEARRYISDIMRDQRAAIPPELDHQLLATQVLDEAVGLGPLEELLADAGVTEIMVNQFDQIYIERNGRLEKHPLTFTSERAVLGVIERIVAPLGRRIDESSPMVDARLKDGSRVNAVIAPLALKGPALTIRKFAKYKMTADDLVGLGAISAGMAAFLEVCVAARKNIVVSGGTGSGKTTLLNILSNFIPSGERIITVEDAAELQLHHEHWISLEGRPANVEGKGAVSIRELVRNTLRMRPDRIVIGECRGGEALDMLQAMNTGHDGSLTTLHANSPRDALARLETMVMMAGMNLPLSAIREQIASAIQMIVQQTRFSCGTRMVTSITEITGMESGKFQIQELFRFINQGYAPKAEGGNIQGYFSGCDMVPGFYEQLHAHGNTLDMHIFKQGEWP
ncbi:MULTISPECIES: ATPase, T2SS/T4P/T4SS family [unclassified Janthinobacterium]|uniref:ATPase, T2SS/T4P/T4SS family n=1 Tax=unclassified Janthinobacterium TaxID=2610881 RepID=UPI0016204DE3|nr:MULTISPECIES: ATPase, T2SS/T4P/T4SS family [unclassified Janthinobacterium]MBB5606647.1 pilus assembly protein CpaF [Janthinobacterium sp. S3T4]MBB5612303.1 pilus assembly protein CpaF [Janthinobacterium sp. S3M3]